MFPCIIIWNVGNQQALTKTFHTLLKLYHNFDFDKFLSIFLLLKLIHNRWKKRQRKPKFFILTPFFPPQYPSTWFLLNYHIYLKDKIIFNLIRQLVFYNFCFFNIWVITLIFWKMRFCLYYNWIHMSNFI